MAIIPGEPWLASFIGAKMMEVVMTVGAIRHAKLRSNHRHQQLNTQLFQAGCCFCRRTNSIGALKGIK